MAQARGPFTIEWGGVKLEGVEEVEPDVSNEIVEYDIVDGSTIYQEGKKRAQVTALMRAQDVAEMAKALADIHLADAATMADGTTVATTDTQGVLEFANTCAAAVTTSDLAVKDCTGEPYLTLKACRSIMEAVEFDGQNSPAIRVRFLSTATTTLGYIGQQ